MKSRNDDSVRTSRNDDSAGIVVMMTVHEQVVIMTMYEQVVMMTVYEEIVRISAVPVCCNARSNTDNPAFNAGSGNRLVISSK